MGKKKQPTYRVVAAESRRARSGAFLEIVGTYQPRGISTAEPDMVLKIDNEKVVALAAPRGPTDRARREAPEGERRPRRVRSGKGGPVSDPQDDYVAGDINTIDSDTEVTPSSTSATSTCTRRRWP